MAYSTLDEIRTGKLNPELGLADDNDNRFGTATERNLALQDAFAQLWPIMARLVREDLALIDRAVDYELDSIRDLQTIEVVNSSGIVTRELRNWRAYDDMADEPPTHRLLLNTGLTDTTVTLRALGYAPYTVPPTGTDACDLEPRLEWIVVAGARAYLFRRRFHQFIDFERRQHENIDNAISPAEFFSMAQEAERKYEAGKLENSRQLNLPRTARLRR